MAATGKPLLVDHGRRRADRQRPAARRWPHTSATVPGARDELIPAPATRPTSRNRPRPRRCVLATSPRTARLASESRSPGTDIAKSRAEPGVPSEAAPYITNSCSIQRQTLTGPADRRRRPADRLRHPRRVRARARREHAPVASLRAGRGPAASASRSTRLLRHRGRSDRFAARRPWKRRTGRAFAARTVVRKNRRRPTLPGGCPPSTIGAERLNCSVRNGKRCFPLAMRHRNFARRAPVELENRTRPQGK